MLRHRHVRTAKIETNTARAPIWAPVRRGPIQLALPLYPMPFLGGQFRLRAGTPLPVRGALLYASFCTTFIADGAPAHRRVPFSLSEAYRLLGFQGEEAGGNNRGRIRALLSQMRALTVESVLRHPTTGDIHNQGWGLIDRWRTASPRSGPGKGWVQLSEEIAALLRAGSYTLFSAATLERLVNSDEVAARLFLFLETERLPGAEATSPYRYGLWSAPPGLPERERNLPAIADLLYLHASARRNVAARVRQAAATVTVLAPEYQLAVSPARETGMWNLSARRLPALRSKDESVPTRRLAPVASRADGVQTPGPMTFASRADGVQTPGPMTFAPEHAGSSTVVPTVRSAVQEIPSDRFSGALPDGRPDLTALAARGWPTVSAAQRARLAEIADRHEQSGRNGAGHAWIASVIVDVPAGTDPLAAVFAADQAWQSNRRQQLQSAEARTRAENQTREADSRASRHPLVVAAFERWLAESRLEPAREPLLRAYHHALKAWMIAGQPGLPPTPPHFD